MPNPIVWKSPLHEFSAKMMGLSLPKALVLSPGKEVDVRVEPFCGSEVCDMTITTIDSSTVEQVCRQAEIAASIQHVERRSCDKCREAFFTALSPSEKAWLYANDPKLGPIIGMEVRGGSV